MRAVPRRKELERDTFGTDRIATTMSSGNQGVSNDGAFVSENTGNFAEALGLFAPEATSVVDVPSTHLPANTPSPIDSTAQSVAVDLRTQSVNPRMHYVAFERRLISVDAEASPTCTAACDGSTR